jgi:hypothetical protein
MAPEGVVYQSAPCAAGASDVLLVGKDPVRMHPLSAEAPRHAPDARGRRAFWRTSIAIGMSDDEVLNLPSWGRPSAISRSKSNRLWHEEWLYRWRNGAVSRLWFANGRLTAVETADGEHGLETPVSLGLR